MRERLAGLLHGIRWRLMLWISLLLLAAVGIAFAIVYSETRSRLNAQIQHDLTADVAQLRESLVITGRTDQSGALSEVAHYLHGQPFKSISTLLFVITPGPVFSNYPELIQSRGPDNDETAAEQQAENAQALSIRRPRMGLSTRPLPDVGAVRILEQRSAVDGIPVVVGAGEPLASSRRALEVIRHSFAVAAAFIALIALLGSYLVGSRLTAPLRRMARVAAQIDAGELEPRMAAKNNGEDEIGVLARAFDHMLDRLERGFRNQRAFVADASHELRTPLTVIRGQLEVLASCRSVDREEVQRVERLVGLEVGRMQRIVDDMLLLAQSERPGFICPEQIDFVPYLTEIWDGASLIAERNFELGELPPGKLRGDPDRLAQALRNLIVNAIDHTLEGAGTIRLEARAEARGWVGVSIADDGPGIAPQELERIFDRFHRTAEDRSAASGRLGGTGLGLSIVREIAAAHGGEVRAENLPEGGTRFELRLPGFATGAANKQPYGDGAAPVTL